MEDEKKFTALHNEKETLFIYLLILIYFAGDGLCAYLIKSGRQDAAISLCRQVASRAQHAVWAWKRLGK